jgi:hypothetical protein
MRVFFSGFRSGVGEVCVVLGYDAASLGNWFPTVRHNEVFPFLKGENIQEECALDILETSETKYPMKSLHIPLK